MRHCRAGLIVALTLILVGRGMGQEPKPDRGGKYALLVGVRKYAPDTLRNLPYTEADVTGLAAVLERSGYRREDITTLTQTVGADDPGLLPLGKNLRAQLGIPETPGQPFKRGLKLGPLDEDDTILIAFAGHGVQFDAQGESYFCPMDADLADEKSLIRLSDVSKALDGCRAGLKLLLVDACRNNPQIRANRAGERPVVDAPSLSRPFPKAKPGGTMALFSCSAGEVAFEDDEVKHGIFFHHVLRGLGGDPGLDGRGADVDGDGKVDANELARFAERNVFLHAGRRYRREQTVEVVNRTRGGVAIVDRGRPAVIVPPPSRPADEKTLSNSIGMKLNLIPAGEFLMGAPDGEPEAGDDEKPRHRVRITRPFYLGVYEVTQAEYRAVTGTNPSTFSATGNGKAKVAGMDTARFPVEGVSWLDAIGFCNKLSTREGLTLCYRDDGTPIPGGGGYRLPTEAEWEYACRAGTTTAFAFGDRLSPSEANFDGNYTYNGSAKGAYLERPTPVGTYRPNAFGLFDVHGNVLEWCSDGYDENHYKSTISDDPLGTLQATIRVFRGGSWNYFPRDARSANRNRYAPDSRSNDLGFRVARVRSGK